MKNIKKISEKISWRVILFLSLLPVNSLLAQGGGVDPGPEGPVSLQNPTTIDSIDALLGAILNFVVTIGGPIVTLAIVYAGFKFVAARGNPAEIQKAKEILWYVLIGAALVLGAWVLKAVITGTVSDIQSGIGG